MTTPAAAVAIDGLAVRFGDFQALAGVGLEIPAGAFVAILGPNGSGKSTLLKVLLGLVAPTQGSVRLFGEVPEQVPPAWVGYVPQVKTLDRSFPARAIELVANGLRRGWPGRLTREETRRAEVALEQVGAAALASRPLGRLSGGELQRVYLARSLVRQPRLVLLDEPASGIDAVGEADMYRLLERYHEASGATVLMVTHDWEAAYHHATHVLVLASRQIAFGPPESALSDATLRRAFGHVDHAHDMHLSAHGRGGCHEHEHQRAARSDAPATADGPLPAAADLRDATASAPTEPRDA